MSPRFPPGRDAVARYRHRNRLVGVPMEIPYRGLNRGSAIVLRNTSTADRSGREKVRPIRDNVPRAGPAHGLAHHIDPPLIDRKLVAQRVDNLQHLTRALPQARDHLELTFL